MSVTSVARMMGCIHLLAVYVLLYKVGSCDGMYESGSGSYPNSDADFYLGGLFPISSSSIGDTCDSIRTQIAGVEYAEAMLFALDSINSNTILLPGVTLGHDIRDTCSVDYVAMDESSKWVSSKIVTQNMSDCLLSASQSTSAYLVGVVGAAFSKISGPVASLLRPFDIPQISYASTSSSLNNRQRYSYFLRTVPPDSLQAQAMVDILLAMNWTVVSALHSNELYGETGMEEFRTAVAVTDICMDLDERIDEDFSEEQYLKLAQKFVDESVANVVVFFALHSFASNFFRQLSKIETERKFLWIASDGWAESEDIQGDYYDEVAGMIELVPFNEPSPEFQEYFSQLTPETNTRNPWFQEYCDAYLQSTLSPDSRQNCSPDASIADFPGYSQDVYVPTVIDAVYSLAYGLHDYLIENCASPIEWDPNTQSCSEQKMEISGPVLFEYITNASFVSLTGRHIEYSAEGYVEESTYEIKNLQRLKGGVNTNTVVAKWNPVNKIDYIVPPSGWQFGLTPEGHVLDTLHSECTTCQPGSVTLLLPSSCCNLCTQCLANNYSNSTTATSCSTCDEHMWGNNPLNGSEHCVPLNESFLSFERPWGIALLFFQIVGLISVSSVIITIVVFLRRNPAIRSFGMEQLAVIFVGLVLFFLLPILYMVKPSSAACAFQQLFLWFSLTLIFAALLVKLIRITRIFLGSSGLHRRFIAPGYQILFTFLIVLGQMVLVAISMAVTSPAPFYFQQNDTANPNNFPELIVSCKPPHPAMLVLLVVYESVLIILINGLAIFTIRFPKNFNESRHIAFATFAIGMIWIAFIPTYVATDNEVRSASITLAVMLMGFGVLGCLIGPRLLTAFQTSKNKEQSFSMHSKKGEFSIQGTYKTEETTVTCEKSNGN